MKTGLSNACHPTSKERAQTTASGSGKTCPGGGVADATTCALSPSRPAAKNKCRETSGQSDRRRSLSPRLSLRSIPEEEAPDLVQDIVWAAPRKSLSDLITYHPCQGTPTVFHLRHTRTLMTRVCSGSPKDASLTFFARSSSFAVKALAQIQRSASRKRAIWSSHVTALFQEGRSQVYDQAGSPVAMDAASLEDQELHALLFLRGMWETTTHVGLRLEVLQVQLASPSGQTPSRQKWY